MRDYCGISIKNGGFETAEILLLPIPYDGTSTWGKGADKGFDAFMEASDNMEVYDIETESEVYKRGVHVLDELNDFASPEEMYKSVYLRSQELLNSGKFLTAFGGEHSISIGLIKAHYERFEDLTILQLDAHADLRPTYLGSAYNHACALNDASQSTKLVQVGIRSMDLSEMQFLNPECCFWAQAIQGQSEWMQESINQMTERVYITLDLDVFDPSILPGTGTPEPGGMDWYNVISYLRMVFEQREVVGFDIVELAPIEGNRISEALAAKLYYKMLSYKFELK